MDKEGKRIYINAYKNERNMGDESLSFTMGSSAFARLSYMGNRDFPHKYRHTNCVCPHCLSFLWRKS